jgi:two-component system invasion response regulator UvrY
MTTVFIADDHALIREGLKKILREESDLTIVGEAQNAAEIFAGIGDSHCDILILDLVLPDRPGLEVLKEVKSRYPTVRVLILSMLAEGHFALRALRAGADGYLSKDSASSELVKALRQIAGGRRYISEAFSQDLAGMIQSGAEDLSHQNLSDREFQILRMIGAGRTVTEIATELNISVSTVNTHRAHILEKMQMRTNAELMRYAIENKLVE